MQRRFFGAGALAAGSIAIFAPTAGAQPAPVLTWQRTSVPQPAPGGHDFQAISCPTADFCMAVGTSTDPGGPTAGPSRPLVETWDGSTWTLRHAITPSGTTRTELSGVSCPTATDCTVVGATGSGNIAYLPLAEVWNGTTKTWRVEDTIYPGARTDDVDHLDSVSCPSTSFCVAVGSEESGTIRALRENWRSGGVGWDRSGPLGPVGSSLGSVSCLSRDQCVAVGQMVTGNGQGDQYAYGDLIQTRRGDTWTMTSAPSPKKAALSAVSCTSASSCVAVGTSNESGGFAVAESGGRWTLTPAPGAELDALSCSSAISCQGAGFTGKGGVEAARWDGSTWTGEAIPAPAGSKPSTTLVDGVSCANAADCLAVGVSTDGDALAWIGSN
jgi:hypothetical protein